MDSYQTYLDMLTSKDRRISQLKNHDYHELLHHFLLLALRGSLPIKGVYKPIIDLCNFYRDICSKDYGQNDFKQLESRVTINLCQLEMIFPSSFSFLCYGTSHHSS